MTQYPSPGTILIVLAALVFAAAPGASGQSAAGSTASRAAAVGSPDSVVELDRNADKAVDYRVVYDHAGMVSREEMDYDYDGAMDTFFYYTNGILQKEEVDSNDDGKVDIWVYLINGTYVQRYERDTDGDGKPDLVREFGKG